MQITAVRTLTQALTAPGLSSSVSGSTANLTWAAPTPTGQSVIAGYRVYRSATLGGTYAQIGSTLAPNQLSFADTLSGTQFYKVEAFDQFVTGARSGGVQCSPVVTGAVKWVPGHHAESDTILSKNSTLTAVQAEMDLGMTGLDNIRGYMPLVTWSHVEPTQGNYNFVTLDAIFNRLKTHYSNPKYFWICFEVGAFSSTAPGGDDIIPAYIMGNTSLYGSSPIAGQSGWWGSGTKITYNAALWRSAVMARFVLMVQAVLNRYQSDPMFLGVYFTEDSTPVGSATGGPVKDGTYSDATFTSLMLGLIDACVAAAPTCNVCLSNSFLFTIATAQQFTVDLINHRALLGQTDTLGVAIDHHSWGQGTYIGSYAPTFPDMRSTNSMVCEIQATDMGFFSQFHYNPSDILNAMNTRDKTAVAFWCIMFTSTPGTQTPQAWWQNLGPFLNNPANQLTNKGYPTGYPTGVSGNVPSAPTIMPSTALTAWGSKAAVARWKPPTLTGTSNLTKYRAYLRIGGIDQGSVDVLPERLQDEFNTVNWLQLQCAGHLTGLTAGSTYTVQITAFNSAGESARSADSNAVSILSGSSFYIACGGGTQGEDPNWNDYSFNLAAAVRKNVAPGATSALYGATAPTNPGNATDNVVELCISSGTNGGTWFPHVGFLKPDGTYNASENGDFNLASFTTKTVKIWPTVSGLSLFPGNPARTLFVYGVVTTGGTGTFTDATQSTAYGNPGWGANAFNGALVYNHTQGTEANATGNTATTVTGLGSQNFAPGDFFTISIPDVGIGQDISPQGSVLIAGQWNTRSWLLTAWDGGSGAYPQVSGKTILKHLCSFNAPASNAVVYICQDGFLP